MADPVPPILPTVRQVIVCHELSLDDTLGSWVVTAPFSVSFLPPGMSFPFREPQVAVYTQLVGGLGAVVFGVQIRQRVTRLGDEEVTYREVGSFSDSEPYVFPGGMNRLAVHEVTFRMFDLPFRTEGTYEFRITAETAEGPVPLDGGVGTVTILANNWEGSDV